MFVHDMVRPVPSRSMEQTDVTTENLMIPFFEGERKNNFCLNYDKMAEFCHGLAQRVDEDEHDVRLHKLAFQHYMGQELVAAHLHEIIPNARDLRTFAGVHSLNVGQIYRSAAPRGYNPSAVLHALRVNLSIMTIIDLTGVPPPEPFDIARDAIYSWYVPMGYIEKEAVFEVLQHRQQPHLPPMNPKSVYAAHDWFAYLWYRYGDLGRDARSYLFHIPLVPNNDANTMETEKARTRGAKVTHASSAVAYIKLMKDGFMKIRVTLLLILTAPPPILICSTLGKDRAAIISAILLNVLGANREAIILDYVASEVGWFHSWPSLDEIYAANHTPKRFRHASVATISEFLDLVASEFGSFNSYLDKLGINVHLRDALRKKYRLKGTESGYHVAPFLRQPVFKAPRGHEEHHVDMDPCQKHLEIKFPALFHRAVLYASPAAIVDYLFSKNIAVYALRNMPVDRRPPATGDAAEELSATTELCQFWNMHRMDADLYLPLKVLMAELKHHLPGRDDLMRKLSPDLLYPNLLTLKFITADDYTPEILERTPFRTPFEFTLMPGDRKSPDRISITDERASKKHMSQEWNLGEWIPRANENRVYASHCGRTRFHVVHGYPTRDTIQLLHDAEECISVYGDRTQTKVDKSIWFSRFDPTRRSMQPDIGRLFT